MQQQLFKSSNKKLREAHQTETRHNFYLSFFDDKKEYQEKQINGFWLIKSVNPDTDQCQASLFSKESYKAYKGKGS